MYSNSVDVRREREESKIKRKMKRETKGGKAAS